MIVLFDLDGVILDTESQYTEFWSRLGKHYLGLDGFGHTIKGQTLKNIFETYFHDMESEQAEILPQLTEFEADMSYDYVPGVYGFMQKLKAAGVPMAIVTSSNDAKMANVYKAHPELLTIVDSILTSEHFSRSKPDPECFLKGMEILGGTPEDTVVFEDSLHGIEAGRSSGAYVVGLATTYPRERIAPLCDKVVSDFTSLTPDNLFG